MLFKLINLDGSSEFICNVPHTLKDGVSIQLHERYDSTNIGTGAGFIMDLGSAHAEVVAHPSDEKAVIVTIISPDLDDFYALKEAVLLKLGLVKIDALDYLMRRLLNDARSFVSRVSWLIWGKF